MKVLFLSHQSEFIYGGEVVTIASLRELRRLGVEVHFAAPAGPYLERARHVAAVHEISSRQFRRSVWQLPRFAAAWWRTRHELAGLVKRLGIDVVHATSLKAMVYAWTLGERTPVVWHHHDILPATHANDLWLRAIGARASLVLNPSLATRDALARAGVPEHKLTVLANGFRPEDWRARGPRHAGAPLRVGLVGEISPRKGTDRLAKVIELLGDFPVEFRVIGEGLSDPVFAAELKRRLASPRVQFLGRQDVKPLYQELDLLLVPSRQDPLPTVIVEAGLSGVPVIGSRAGGIPEMVVDGKNGFLFDTEEEAAQSIRKAEASWEELSKGARQIAEERYDIAKLSQRLLRHYEDLGAGARKLSIGNRENR